jgi:hypothetical protein
MKAPVRRTLVHVNIRDCLEGIAFLMNIAVDVPGRDVSKFLGTHRAHQLPTWIGIWHDRLLSLIHPDALLRRECPYNAWPNIDALVFQSMMIGGDLLAPRATLEKARVRYEIVDFAGGLV